MAGLRKYQKQAHETGVYGVINTITGRYYIGSSITLSKRMGVHLRDLRKGIHHSAKLQRSFNKHGEAAFEFQVLLACDEAHVEFFENRAIKAYDSYANGYNVAPEAKGGFMRGKKWKDDDPRRSKDFKWHLHTDETKAKIKQVLSDQSEEIKQLRKARIGAANSKPKSEQGRMAIIEGLKKRYENPEAHEQTAKTTKDSWVARREKYGPTGRKPKNSSLVSSSEEVIYG